MYTPAVNALFMGAVAVLVGALVLYALGHYASMLVFALSARRESAQGPLPGAVTVLIPARNEGVGALHAVRSVIAQDLDDDVEVWVLVRDDDDTAWPVLQAAFDFDEGVAQVADGRRVRWVACGMDPKAAKIRHAVEGIETPYAAILDADHVAHPEWLRSALTCLSSSRAEAEKGGGPAARVVQCRRYPLAARGFFRLWDSLHQHVGCELFNVAFQRLGLTVFFTGTTALFETDVLREHPMRDVITEDVDLSYTLFFEGELIVSDPRFGSIEQVSPDLYSFLARRRRWASGHTGAFFHHLRKLPKARLPLFAKLQFLFHGSHYLWALPVFVLHLLVGQMFARQLSPLALTAACVAAPLAAYGITRGQRTLGRVHRLLEWALISAWLLPAAVMLINLLTAVLTGMPERAALPLPEAQAYLQPLALAGFFAPLLLIVLGLFRFGQLGLGTFLSVTLTYPLAFYLDVSGALLGALDRVMGKRNWRVIEREISDESASLPAPVGLRESCALGGAVALSPVPTQPTSRWTRAVFAAAAAAVAIGVVGSPSRVVGLADVDCTVLQADGHPWIEQEGLEHCEDTGPRFAIRTGTEQLRRDDPLITIDESFWTRGDATFPCNESHFRPENVVQTPQGVRFELRDEAFGDRRLTAGALSTGEEDEDRFLFGRFEVEMKASDASGVVSAFFLYRFDPWQEIDFELLGNNTTQAMLNVYYNPGEPGDEYNYGHRGTPVTVDLGFDAAEDFHRYAIEWDAYEIRWFADDKLIHVRRAGEPTPIPHLPMVFHMNAWATCSEELAGPIRSSDFPTAAEFRHATVSDWQPVARTPLDHFFAIGDVDRNAWMTPGD